MENVMKIFRYAIICFALLSLTACPSEDPPVMGEIDNIPGASENTDAGDDINEPDDVGEAQDTEDENDTQSPPSTVDTCESNDDCDDEEYCKMEIGTCRKGICEPLPDEEDCVNDMIDYCDCNGDPQISDTTCILEPILSLGYCGDTGVVQPGDGGGGDDAGDPCKYNHECDDGEYCKRAPGCETHGLCTALPSADYIQENCEETPTLYCDCDAKNELTSPTTCIFDAYYNEGPCQP